MTHVSSGWRMADFLPLMTFMLLALAGFTLRAVDEKYQAFQAGSNPPTESFMKFTTTSSNFIARFETFSAGSNTYRNATILTTNRTDIFLRHASGLVNVKVKDVDPEILKQLGYEIIMPESKESRTAIGPMSQRMITNLTQQLEEKLEENPRFHEIGSKWQAQLAPMMPPISKGVIAGVVGVFAAIYLFFSFCCMLIVKKTGNQPGPLIWLPILKMLPLIRAAGMPGWWFLAWTAPLVTSLVMIPLILTATMPVSWLPFFSGPASLASLVAGVVWCFKIVGTRGKGVVWAVMLLLPLTNLIAFLYLAFSDGAASPAAKPAARPLARAA